MKLNELRNNGTARQGEKPTVAILFAKCLGFSDSRAQQTFRVNPDTGETELSDCLNLTVTSDGCLEKLAPYVTALATGAAVTKLSADSRLFFSDGTNTKEWTTGTTIVNRFPSVMGPIAHTMLDVRVSGTSVFKTVGPAIAEAVVGQYTGPATTKTFSAMPSFQQAFVYNARMYAINKADQRWLQYSTPYSYDLYNLGDDHIGSPLSILQAGAIPGVLITTHAQGVTVYQGMDPDGEGFSKRFYPMACLHKTLYSGFISKAVGYAHVFLCADGVYMIDSDGKPVNLTTTSLDSITAISSSFLCSGIQDGKYLAFGASLGIEYDFENKILLKRAAFGIQDMTFWNGQAYYAQGFNIISQGPAIDSSAAYTAFLTLPFSTLGAHGAKSIYDLYFTGIIEGNLLITATDTAGNSWEHEVSDVGTVTNYRIKTPLKPLGNHISFTLSCVSGAFRLEKLQAVFSASQRSQ